MKATLPLLGTLLLLAGCAAGPAPEAIRVMTANIEDVRGDDLRNPDHPRLKAAAALMQALQPDILLFNEIAYDQEGAPGYDPVAGPGQNGQRFADHFLAVPQADTLQGRSYTAFMRPSNTGLSSGFDYDNDGQVATTYPSPPAAAADGTPARQTSAGRAYGNDSFGFGTFPGQYAMALFVREGFEIVYDEVRTFQHFRWADMPGALVPHDTTGAPWYSPEEWAAFRLSSKTHMDIPVRTPSGQVIHILASHPTPAAFDGPEQRNKKRNHDEIRFWADYLSGAAYIRDDAGRAGGLPEGRHFIIAGDLNADPDEGNALNDPIGSLLLSHPRIQGNYVPVASPAGQAAFPDLDPDDTARWRLRVDYVLPSTTLTVMDGGVWRPSDPDALVVSDHFPVWIDVRVPAE